MTIETVGTIKSALNTLRNMHEYVSRNNKNPEIRECALKGIKRVDSAIFEFDNLIASHPEV